jgi:Outer membrane protein beta-barrel domain
MLKTFMTIGALASVLSLSAIGRAQALPTATAAGSFQIGVGYTTANPDYGQKYIQGVTGFADFDFGLHLGVEADVHYVAFITPLDLAENTYLIGPRFIYPHGRFKIYGKVLAGYGDLVIQEYQDNIGRPAGFYFTYAGGGGIDVRATDHITIRAIDVEAQKWPNYGNGLSPIVYTVGAAYHFR